MSPRGPEREPRMSAVCPIGLSANAARSSPSRDVISGLCARGGPLRTAGTLDLLTENELRIGFPRGTGRPGATISLLIRAAASPAAPRGTPRPAPARSRASLPGGRGLRVGKAGDLGQ